jgi:CoA-transferase family III
VDSHGTDRRAAGDHCRTVLALTDPLPTMEPAAELAAWAASGAMSLTGRSDGDPLGPPRGFVSRLQALGIELCDAARAIGGHLDVQPLALLSERAAIAGLHRRGATSVGGATRLLATAQGWMAISLARPDDVALVPAWLELDGPPADPWAAVASAVSTRSAADLVERARLLGLPAAVLGEAAEDPRSPVLRTRIGDASGVADIVPLTVVELGSLWAGPLCGSLLQMAGATVIKVESTARPDGARRGPHEFFDLLNGGKQSVGLDLATTDGARALRNVVARADVVIEASRPRALEQLGIVAADLLAGDGPRAWVSITGHGRDGPARDWVAFGDDAAVAGGLVAGDDAGPVFCADAVADPVAGVVAACAALEAVGSDGRWLVDVALSAVAASLAGSTVPVTGAIDVAEPTARPVIAAGPRLGQDNSELLVNEGSGR